MIPKQPKLPRIQLDWRAYYARFCQAHGDHPVIHEGMQLFSDGWRYTLKDYSGPEFPAPTDPKELRQLQVAYWTIRHKQVTLELETLKARVQNFKNLQEAKSVPLQVVQTRYDEDRRVNVRELVDLDLSIYDNKIYWLGKDVEECAAQLQALQPQEQTYDQA